MPSGWPCLVTVSLVRLGCFRADVFLDDNGDHFVVYGDSIYVHRQCDFLAAPLTGHLVSPACRAFNKIMASARVSMEWR